MNVAVPSIPWVGCGDAVKRPTGQKKKVRCLFLLPFIAIFALHLVVSPPTHVEGLAHLLPMIRRMRRQYTLPPHYRRKNKQDPAPHTYRLWRPCLLLLYFASCYVSSEHRSLPTRGHQPPTATRYSRAFRSTAHITHATTASGSSNVATHIPTRDTGGYTSSAETLVSYHDHLSLSST